MRKLKVSTLVTLDGVIQDPGGFGETKQGGWANAYFTEEATQDSLEHLMEDPFFIALPREHPLADAPSVRMEDLRDETWIEGELCAEALLGADPSNGDALLSISWNLPNTSTALAAPLYSKR